MNCSCRTVWEGECSPRYGWWCAPYTPQSKVRNPTLSPCEVGQTQGLERRVFLSPRSYLSRSPFHQSGDPSLSCFMDSVQVTGTPTTTSMPSVARPLALSHGEFESTGSKGRVTPWVRQHGPSALFENVQASFALSPFHLPSLTVSVKISPISPVFC